MIEMLLSGCVLYELEGKWLQMVYTEASVMNQNPDEIGVLVCPYTVTSVTASMDQGSMSYGPPDMHPLCMNSCS